MEESVEFKNLEASDLDLVWELIPEAKQYIFKTLWRAYGNKNCIGLFTWSQDLNIWCGHMIADEKYRGKSAIEIFKRACEQIYKDIGCTRILGLTDKHRRDAPVAARSIGFKRIGEAGGYVFSLLEKGDL